MFSLLRSRTELIIYFILINFFLLWGNMRHKSSFVQTYFKSQSFSKKGSIERQLSTRSFLFGDKTVIQPSNKTYEIFLSPLPPTSHHEKTQTKPIKILTICFRTSDSFRSMWYELASALEDFLFSDM